jgi:hypothetical protein
MSSRITFSPHELIKFLLNQFDDLFGQNEHFSPIDLQTEKHRGYELQTTSKGKLHQSPGLDPTNQNFTI